MKNILRIALLVILFSGVILFVLSSLNMTYRKYKKNVQRVKEDIGETEILTEEDIKEYPTAIKNYLRYVGAVGKEKVTHFEATLSGEMKMDETKEFAPINVNQYNVINPSTRLFFINMKYNGMKINGIHHYENADAMMKIKLLDLFTVVDESGSVMNQAETVTVLNDLFIFAPGSIIDDRITYEEVDDLTVNVSFTNEDITVTATIYFNNDGQLVNFVSYDRWITDGEIDHTVSWSTPITEYKDNNGLLLPYKGSAVWTFEDREFEYIKLVIDDVKMNP